MNTFRSLLAVAVLSASTFSASAGDEGLYEGLPPENAGFVRWLNLDASQVSVQTTDGKIDVPAASLAPYAVAVSGAKTFAVGDKELPVDVEAGKFYTVVASGPLAGKVFEDEAPTDPTKSRLYFYNLTDSADVDLFVPKAKKDALSDVASGASKSVDLKAPLTIDMVARVGGEDVAQYPGVALKRRGGSSLVLYGDNEAISAVNAVSAP